MRCYCVSMSKKELVLPSYLTRVFEAKTIEKKTKKILYFTIEKLREKGWQVGMLKNFVYGTASIPSIVKIYKSNLNE